MVYFSGLGSLGFSEDRLAFADNKRVAVDSIIRLENSVADRARSGEISTKVERAWPSREFLNFRVDRRKPCFDIWHLNVA